MSGNGFKDARKVISAPINSMSYNEFVKYFQDSYVIKELKLFMAFFRKNMRYRSEEKPNTKALFKVEAYNPAIDFYLYNFYEKYKTEDINAILILLKEEWLKECFILEKYHAHYKKLTENKELWQLAYFLECSTWYEFTYVINPTKLGLPENLTAKEYYLMLQLMMQRELNDNSMMDEDDESNEIPGDSSKDQLGSSNEDSTAEGSSGGSENQDDDSDNKEEASDSEETKDSTTAANNGYSKEGKAKTTFDEQDIMNFLKSKGVSNKELEIIDKTFEEVEEFTNANVGLAKEAHITPVMFNKNRKDKDIDRFFKRISRYINNVETEMKIVKCDNISSYHKYSWKTDSRNDGVIYPGRKRINGGLTKKFKQSPVVFFDRSGSTSYLNNCLNALAAKCWEEGYTICMYSGQLDYVVEPDQQSFFCFPSEGGTHTLKAVSEYFKQKGYNKDRNIYVLTDGDETYYNLFETYPRTIVFKLEQNKNDYTGAYYRVLKKIFLNKDGVIEETKNV